MSEKKWMILTGFSVGLLGVLLVLWGNPPNMGFCAACFLRDVAGALGLHNNPNLQYLRPEIIGLVLGAFLAALFRKEFHPRGGSSTVLRFFLGAGIMVGALVFLGCPLRMILRLAAGDLNALVGLFGFITGVFTGTLLLRAGFSLGRSQAQSQVTGMTFPAVILLLGLAVLTHSPLLKYSVQGPGAMAAPVLLSLGAGLILGVLAQRSRLCMAGGFRDLFLIGDPHLFWGPVVIFLTALAGNIWLGNFHLGFAGQPLAHTNHLFNFLGLAVVGLGSVMAGGCPYRQLVLAGQGDGDAAVTVLGMIVGAALAHNFNLVASPQGVPVNGQVAVVVVLFLMLAVGWAVIRASQLTARTAPGQATPASEAR